MISTHHFLLLGSNHDAVDSMVAALFALRSNTFMRRRSSVYQTPAEGLSTSSHYLNIAVAVEFDDTEALWTLCKDVERAAGRSAADSARGQIALDIDLVFSGSLEDPCAAILIHKPKMIGLAYCYAPMAEIALEFLLKMPTAPAVAERSRILNAAERFSLGSLL